MSEKYISSIEIDDIIYQIKDAELREKFNDLIKDAPEALNTLEELAAALDNDPNLATTILEKINTLDNVLKDILAAIESNTSAIETVDAIEQIIVSYLENKTISEVEE